MEDKPEDLVDVPKEFYQDSEKTPFCKCTFCAQDLSKGNEVYLVEKSFAKSLDKSTFVTVIEYAICMACSMKKMQAISKESLQAIQNYMEEKVYVNLTQSKHLPVEEKLKYCILTGEDKNDLEAYNLVGQFVGNKMIQGTFPMLITGAVNEEVQGLLSEKTKEEFNRFMDTITTVPPELRALFKTNPPVLV